MKFEELNLHNETLQALNNNNQHQANSFQKSVIDAVKSEQNLIIKADESSKAQALAVAAVDKINSVESKKGSIVLILSDSDERLKAIERDIKALKAEIDCALIDVKGNSDTQIDEIAKGHAAVLANPDRLHAILKKNRYIFRHLKLLVLNRLDEMVSSDHGDALINIKKRILSNYTSIITAGEHKGQAKKIASNFADSPKVNGFGPPPPPAVPGQLSQKYINVPPRMKISTLLAHLKNTRNGNCIIFTNSKRGTDRLYRILKKQRMKAVSLHYKLSDQRRAQRFANFANGNVQYLLVSDISASKLKTNSVTQVVNYDVPASPDEYRYRAGLVGDGKNSQIVSLVSKQDQSDIHQLQNDLGETPEEMPLPDKVKQKLKERKRQNRSNRKNGRGNKKQQKEAKELELPRPTYDQLSGGRSGSDKDEEKGLVTFFKKLFS